MPNPPIKPVAPKTPKPKKAVVKTVASAKVSRTKVVVQPDLEVKMSPKAVVKPKAGTLGVYLLATGKRKTAIANVKLFDVPGELTINRKPLEAYFNAKPAQAVVMQAFQLTGVGEGLHCEIFVTGGGTMSQAGAVRHALARVLLLKDPALRIVLKKNGLLTRDSRKKERKKPGLKRARRAPQWAKR